MKDFKMCTKGNLYYLKWDGGGEMPQALQGLYTSTKDALKAATVYLETRRPKKGQQNASDHARAK